MIRIKRSDKVPATLISRAVEEAREAIKEIAVKTKPMSKQFPTLWGKRDVREALWIMQNKKCCYCERRRDMNRESDIDHFRPKAEVTMVPNHKGYWWLAYDWNNLLFCCRYCNQSYKLNHFPVPDEGKRICGEAQSITQERAFLLDPCSDFDDPESCFNYYVKELKLPNGEPEFLVYVQARPDDEWKEQRARKTIEILGLNRVELLEERGKYVEKLRMLGAKMFTASRLMAHEKEKEAAAEIRRATSASQPFAGFCRTYLRELGLGDYVSTD